MVAAVVEAAVVEVAVAETDVEHAAVVHVHMLGSLHVDLDTILGACQHAPPRAAIMSNKLWHHKLHEVLHLATARGSATGAGRSSRWP